jgi:hypothetical protein
MHIARYCTQRTDPNTFPASGSTDSGPSTLEAPAHKFCWSQSMSLEAPQCPRPMYELPPHALKIQVVPVHVWADEVQPKKPQEVQQRFHLLQAKAMRRLA